MTRSRRATLLVAIPLLFAACGGSTPSTTEGSGGQPTANTPGDTAATEPTSPPDAEPTENTGGNGGNGGNGGGSFTGSACDLLSASEVEQASGQANIEAQATAPEDLEDQSQCGYVAYGVLPVVIVTVLGADTNADPNSYLALPGSEQLSLSGASGIWAPGAGFIAFVFKGGTIVAVAALGPAEGIDQKAMGQQLAQKVADRLP